MIGINLRIIESTAACSFERVRTYAKRRAKSASYWRRMDKKWLKRYGLRAIPTAYMMDTDLTGFGMGQVLVVHPALAPQYRKAINEAFPLRSAVDNYLNYL